MPIKSHDGEVLVFLYSMSFNSSAFFKEAFCTCFFQVIGVAQIINKKSGEHQFTQKDEEVWLLLLLWWFVSFGMFSQFP